ncbi:MFS transporter [Azonexus sp. IMCC34839]|uniref:MFS transporter n=1 Tax=Azonexus sp. IMCC34839 TaxID=3133695 RepID=UPI00399A273E
MAGRRVQVIAIGVAQTIAWASSTYLPAAVAQPLAASLGLAPSSVFAAFSGALGVMALLGPAIGRRIDRHGGRGVLCTSNLILAAGLVWLAASASLWSMVAAWLLIGVGMACGLYDAAFAALVREHGLAARAPITGVTLLGGFASTVGWPLTSWLVAAWDWRVACLAWAAVHLAVALPLNLRFFKTLPAALASDKAEAPAVAASPAEARRNFWLLALFGAATAFVTSALAAHLPLLLVACGIAPAAAIAAAALFGPAQVLARLTEFWAASRGRTEPLTTARWATALHPGGAGLMLAFAGSPMLAAVFVVLHGAGNGLITIAKGVLPLALFGAQGYGVLQGKLAVLQRTMQAAAPLAFALVLERGGASAGLALTLAVSLLGWGALMLIQRPN